MWEKVVLSDLAKRYSGTVGATNTNTNTSSAVTLEDLKKIPIIDYTATSYAIPPTYKKTGTIPPNTHIYKRILVHCNYFRVQRPLMKWYFPTIFIIEGDDLPKEDPTSASYLFLVSQEWLKRFITPEELVEMTASRMIGNVK